MDAAAKLRAARLHAGLTQQQLAELSGVRQANIAAYERDLRHPSRLMLQRLLDASRPRPSVILNANRAKIREIAARHQAHNVRVFGSVARYRPTEQ